VNANQARRKQKQPLEDSRLADITAVIDAIAGPGYGRQLLDRLSDSAQNAESIALDMAKSVRFAALYKSARASNIMTGGRKDADPAMVGLPELKTEAPFLEQFKNYFYPLLGNRADGFQTIFETVLSRPERPLIIETGCLRIPGNWAGDGQSTFMFDAMSDETHGHFFSIDITLESIDTARSACSSGTQLICNNSIAALHTLAELVNRPASLLYLDSFDLDISNPLPSAIHHLMELTAARPLIGQGTIVCIDDYMINGHEGGKGLLVDQFFSQIRTRVLYTGYQKIWLCA
jgi:hypothetical protein